MQLLVWRQVIRYWRFTSRQGDRRDQEYRGGEHFCKILETVKPCLEGSRMRHMTQRWVPIFFVDSFLHNRRDSFCMSALDLRLKTLFTYSYFFFIIFTR